MNKIYRSIAITLSLMTLFFWFSRKKKPVSTRSNKLVVGTNAEFPPFSFMQEGKVVGFDIDIIRQVAEQIGKPVTIKEMPFEALIPALQLEKIQIIAAGISPSPTRAQRVFFTKPHLTNNPLVIITLSNKQPSIKNIEDLKGREVVVNEGYIADIHISSITGPIINRLSSPLVVDGILALKSGRADAFITAKQSIKPFFVKHGKKEFTITPIPDTDEKYSFAVSKNDPKLFNQIQAILDSMQQDGTLQQLKQKWNVHD